MLKTANKEPKPTPPPTDAEVVKAFIAEAETFDQKAAAVSDERTALLYRCAAEARRTLALELGLAKEARRQFVKDAGDRLVNSFTEAGQKFADFINTVYNNTEDRADQDRK